MIQNDFRRPMLRGAAITALSLLLPTLTACGASQHSKQFMDAQQAIHSAENGRAAQLAPAHLLEAKKTMKQAEAKDNGSPEEAQLAYVADRQARVATAYGDMAWEQQRLIGLRQKYQQQQTEQRRAAEADLRRAKDKLAETKEALSTVQKRLDSKDGKVADLEHKKQMLEAQQSQLEGQLQDRQKALTEERAKREAAEKRAADAMKSLQEIANVKEDANETTITLSGSVLFKTDSADLLPIARDSLDRVADALKNADDDRTFVIEGHTDSRGSATHNQKLSLDRAQSVRDYLVNHGVDSSRVTTVGRGEAEPVATNQTAEGRANNRRVEIIIRKK
ncbi:MAG: OmpA family protein [Polyangiaceae bacterium]|nr:OmpA family protein [Polyangiaceae bacterium]